MEGQICSGWRAAWELHRRGDNPEPGLEHASTYRTQQVIETHQSSDEDQPYLQWRGEPAASVSGIQHGMVGTVAKHEDY